MAYSDAFSDVIRSNWSTCQVFVDLRKGTYQDLSGNARVMTLTNGVPIPTGHTTTSGKGLNTGIVRGNSARITTPNAAALNLAPSGTIAVFFTPSRTIPGGAAAELLVAKTTIPGTTAYWLYRSAGFPNLYMFDGATSHQIGIPSWVNTHSLAASFTNGTPPYGYENGAPMFPLVATNWAPVAGDASVLSLGNYSTGVYGSPHTWLCFLLFNARLTGAEIAQLHSDWMASAYYL